MFSFVNIIYDILHITSSLIYLQMQGQVQYVHLWTTLLLLTLQFQHVIYPCVSGINQVNLLLFSIDMQTLTTDSTPT